MNKTRIFLWTMLILGMILVAIIYVTILFPMAYAQILPFEQQLEQIRNPQECTRKVVQASSAQIPFTLKVFYDTTKDAVLEIKQQGSTFPLTQRTNQVMTFYTNGTDQYEIYMEMNYPEPLPRQIYIEYLSQDVVTYSGQEKFEGTKFCMTIFANTVLPPRVPTKQEIFGEALDYIAQIPSMVTAFNANTVTTSTSISFMWMLLLGFAVIVVLIYINTVSGKRNFNSMMKDGRDAVNVLSDHALKMEKLVKKASETVDMLQTSVEEKNPKRTLVTSMKKEQPKQKKRGNFFSKFRKDKKPELNHNDDEEEFEEIIEIPKPKSIEQELLEELAMDEPKATAKIIEEQVKEEVNEQNPDLVLKPFPPRFIEMIKSINYEEKKLKDGVFEKFTYPELNILYGWICHYRKHMNLLRLDIPKEIMLKQEIAGNIIYDAIYKKMELKLQND